MWHRTVIASALLVLACKSGSDTSKTPPAQPAPEPAPPNADEDPAADPATGPCVGDESGLDLSAIATDSCPIGESSQPLPADAVKTFLSPSPLDLAGFGRGDLRVAIVNVSGEPITFDLTLGCGPWHGLTLSAVPEGGADELSFAPGEVYEGEFSGYCGRAARCGLRSVRITLTDSGRAFVPVTLDLPSRSFDEQCMLEKSPPLPDGRYQLRAAFPNTDRIPAATGSLRISS